MEGDTAEVIVHNLMDEETSLHWHGLHLPNKEDGVPLAYPETHSTTFNLHVFVPDHPKRNPLVSLTYWPAGADWNVWDDDSEKTSRRSYFPGRGLMICPRSTLS